MYFDENQSQSTLLLLTWVFHLARSGQSYLIWTVSAKWFQGGYINQTDFSDVILRIMFPFVVMSASFICSRFSIDWLYIASCVIFIAVSYLNFLPCVLYDMHLYDLLWVETPGMSGIVCSICYLLLRYLINMGVRLFLLGWTDLGSRLQLYVSW